MLRYTRDDRRGSFSFMGIDDLRRRQFLFFSKVLHWSPEPRGFRRRSERETFRLHFTWNGVSSLSRGESESENISLDVRGEIDHHCRRLTTRGDGETANRFAQSERVRGSPTAVGRRDSRIPSTSTEFLVCSLEKSFDHGRSAQILSSATVNFDASV